MFLEFAYVYACVCVYLWFVLQQEDANVQVCVYVYWKEQCVEEGVTDEQIIMSGEGCHIYGYLEVNKVKKQLTAGIMWGHDRPSGIGATMPNRPDTSD